MLVLPCKDCLLLPKCFQDFCNKKHILFGFKLKKNCELLKDYVETGSRKTKFSTILLSKRLHEVNDFYDEIKNKFKV